MCLSIPCQVVALVDPARKLALVDRGGVRQQVDLAAVVDEAHPVEAWPGEWVLVHLGFAVRRVDPGEAEATLRLLAELAEAQAAVAAGREG